MHITGKSNLESFIPLTQYASSITAPVVVLHTVRRYLTSG